MMMLTSAWDIYGLRLGSFPKAYFLILVENFFAEFICEKENFRNFAICYRYRFLYLII